VTRKYEEGGLDNVTLKGVQEFRCAKCGEVYYNYGNIEQLHQLIAAHLVRKKDLLTGKEIRFLRKHMGYSSTVLAKLVGQELETISRIENEKSKVTALFDHYVRALVIQKGHDRNYDLHDHILNETGEEFSRLEASFKKDGWNVRSIA
jgi:putative zinc finger/helix-turn-helix YgiT family protein